MDATSENAAKEKSGDPLSELTRKERKTFLAVSTVGIAIGSAGLVPTKISALGIDFDKTDQRTLQLLLVGVILYFGFAFIIYAATDGLNWWHITWKQVHEERVQRQRGQEGGHKVFEEAGDSRDYLFARLRERGFMVRAMFDFVLPLIWGLIAVISILCATC